MRGSPQLFQTTISTVCTSLVCGGGVHRDVTGGSVRYFTLSQDRRHARRLRCPLPLRTSALHAGKTT